MSCDHLCLSSDADSNCNSVTFSILEKDNSKSQFLLSDVNGAESIASDSAEQSTTIQQGRRKKVSIKFIPNKSKRQSTFCKRKGSLLKKVCKICELFLQHPGL